MSLRATSLSPGQTITAPGETDPLGATVLFQTNVAFSSTSFYGILTSTVLTGDTSNPFGGLTFTYEFNLNAGSPDAASAITIGGFSNFLVDVSYQLPTNGLPPAEIGRSPTGGGKNITFSFIDNGYVLPGGN